MHPRRTASRARTLADQVDLAALHSEPVPTDVAAGTELTFAEHSELIQAHAADEVVPIGAASRYSSPDYQLAVAPGVEVESVEDLEGLKIAYSEGMGRRAYVLRALEKAGLGIHDVASPARRRHAALGLGKVTATGLRETA